MQSLAISPSRIRLQRLTFALVLVLLSGMVVFYVVVSFQHIRNSENDKLAIQASVVAANIELHITSINHVLEEILALVNFADPGQQRDHMQSLVNAMPIIRAISILDSDGRQTMGTREANNGRDFNDRPYFRNARADPRPLTLHISTPYRSTSGDITLSLSKAVSDRDGRFAGVVVVTLEADYVRGLMESTLYAPDMWAELTHIDSRESIRVQSAIPSKLLTGSGSSTGSSTVQAANESLLQSGHHHTARQLMATRSITSYTPLTKLPLLIVTGRDYHEAMADWRRFAYLQVGLLVLFIITTTAGLLFLQQRYIRYAIRQAIDRRLIRAQEQDYRIIVERTATCIVRLDVDGDCSYVNPAFSSLFGIPFHQAVGRSFVSLMDEDDMESTQQSVRAVLQEPSEQHFRAKCLTPTGPRHVEWALCSVVDNEGSVSGVIGIGHDISDHITLHEKLRTLAERDGLTGLFNRRHFMETAANEVARAQRSRQPLSLMMLDLDHFKKVNDTWGHQGGDVALQVCAYVMQEACREFDIPARVGGEEFAILLPDTANRHAVAAAERVRRLIAAQPVTLDDGHSFYMTASFGVATLQPGETIGVLMQRADKALYTAKQNGRNRVEAATETAESAVEP